jgi:UDP-2-acetamido-3-amino-2,3-dideoxy-glucuronate N-acetyltransferase
MAPMNREATTAPLAPEPSDLAPGLMLSPGARIQGDVTFGFHVVVYPDVVLGEGCSIGDLAVLGKPPTLTPTSRARGVETGPLVVEAGAVVATGAIVCAGARICAGAVVGDQAGLRERAVLGPDSMIGRHCALGPGVTTGARVRMQNSVAFGGPAVVEDDVFIGPGVLAPNDPTAARHGSGDELQGPILRRACRIGAGALLMPGIEVGEEAFVGAGAVVTRDVRPRSVVKGAPARVSRDVTDAELLERWR